MRPQRENNLELLFKVLAHDQIKFDPELITDKDFILGARCTSIVKPNDFDFLHDLSHLVQFNETEIYTHYMVGKYLLMFLKNGFLISGFVSQ